MSGVRPWFACAPEWDGTRDVSPINLVGATRIAGRLRASNRAVRPYRTHEFHGRRDVPGVLARVPRMALLASTNQRPTPRVGRPSERTDA
jgi:hypothetical protein